MLFEKIKEIIFEDNIWARKAVNGFKIQMMRVDNAVKLMTNNENKEIMEKAQRRLIQ